VEGYWKNGKLNGKGRVIAANGNVYEGNFKNNKMNGYGIYVYVDGD